MAKEDRNLVQSPELCFVKSSIKTEICNEKSQ
jgi:hypothetical protein